ncbi:MAG: hypothetical protein ACFFD6_05515 [Candidatus Thorarchaeota archaeon]
MIKSDERTAMKLPMGVTPESLMASLELGHGYIWKNLTRTPIQVIYGSSSRGNLPEILILGEHTLLLSVGDDVYADRIQSILEMLNRQSHRAMGNLGGANVG